jgi:hypothetical protein
LSLNAEEGAVVHIRSDAKRKNYHRFAGEEIYYRKSANWQHGRKSSGSSLAKYREFCEIVDR